MELILTSRCNFLLDFDLEINKNKLSISCKLKLVGTPITIWDPYILIRDPLDYLGTPGFIWDPLDYLGPPELFGAPRTYLGPPVPILDPRDLLGTPGIF